MATFMPRKMSATIKMQRKGTAKSRTAQVNRINAGYKGFTPELKKAVLARDGHRCRVVIGGVRCPNPSSEVHHIVSVASGGKSVMMNLMAICHSCHTRRPGHGHLFRQK